MFLCRLYMLSITELSTVKNPSVKVRLAFMHEQLLSTEMNRANMFEEFKYIKVAI